MDKSSHSAADSAATATTTTRDQYLRQLNKLSHKISKSSSASARPSVESHAPGLDSNQQNNLQQPPVYNISKSDFREVVQKLTGSPAHERLASPPPIQPPKPPSSRLHRIRPPPLSQLANRPPPLLNATGPQGLNPNLLNQAQIPAPAPVPAAANSNPGDGSFVNPISRPVAPLSPLPPLPAVHAAAESPVSAYMRYLQSCSTPIESKPHQFTGFSPLAPVAPLAPFPPPPPQQFQLPLSPLPFGRLNSPKSPYSLLFSPTSGFPLSPTLPVLSPKGGAM